MMLEPVSRMIENLPYIWPGFHQLDHNRLFSFYLYLNLYQKSICLPDQTLTVTNECVPILYLYFQLPKTAYETK